MRDEPFLAPATVKPVFVLSFQPLVSPVLFDSSTRIDELINLSATFYCLRRLSLTCHKRDLIS